jgi:hypothetical protein
MKRYVVYQTRTRRALEPPPFRVYLAHFASGVEWVYDLPGAERYDLEEAVAEALLHDAAVEEIDIPRDLLRPR